MQALTKENVQSAYLAVLNPTGANIQEANNFLGAVYKETDAILLHIELLAGTTDQRLRKIVFIGLAQAVSLTLGQASVEVAVRLRDFLCASLRDCTSVEYGRDLCDVVSTAVLARTKGKRVALEYCGPLFELATGMLNTADYPRAVCLDLWAGILSTFKESNVEQMWAVLQRVLECTYQSLQSENQDERASAMSLVDSFVWSFNPYVNDLECQFCEKAWEPMMEALVKLGEYLYTHCGEASSHELSKFVSFFGDIFEDQENKRYIVEKMRPLIVVTETAVANEAIALSVRNHIHSMLTAGREFIAQSFDLEEIASMMKVGIKLAVEMCAASPDEMAWKNHQPFFADIVECGENIQVIFEALTAFLPSQVPYQRLVGIMLVGALVEKNPHVVDQKMMTAALAAGDVDSEVFIVTTCQMLDDCKAHPRVLQISFNTIAEYLLKWYKYDSARFTLPTVIKAIKMRPQFFKELFTRLASMAAVPDMGVLNIIIDTMGACLAEAVYPVEGFFEVLAPILERAIQMHADFAPAVLMCFGNLVAVAPSQIIELLPKLMEYTGTILKSTEYSAVIQALRLIRKIALYLIISFEPFLPTFVPILAELAAREMPDSPEMYIESNRLNHEHMKRDAMICLCIIAREVDSLKQSVGKPIWETCSTSTESNTIETMKYIHYGQWLFYDLQCDLSPMMQQVLSLLQVRESAHKVLLQALIDMITCNSQEFVARWMEKISDFVMSAMEGMYNVFLVVRIHDVKVPSALRRCLWQVFKTLIDQVKSGISAQVPVFITRIQHEFVRDGTRSDAMFLQLCSKMVYYCPEHRELTTYMFGEVVQAFGKTRDPHGVFYLLIAFSYLLIAGREIFKDHAPGLLSRAEGIENQAAGALKMLVPPALALSATIITTYNPEIPDERLLEIINKIDFSLVGEIMPLLVNFLIDMTPRFPDAVKQKLPSIAAAVLAAEPLVWGNIKKDALLLVLQTAAQLNEDQWFSLLSMNQTTFRKVQRNIANLTQFVS